MRVKAEITNGLRNWEEEFTVPSLEEAEGCISEVIKNFNEKEKAIYGEKAKERKLLKILEEAQDVHDWVKRAVIFNNKVEYKCTKCGLVKRYHFASLSRPSIQIKCYPDRVCSICNLQFASAKNCERHKQKKHSEN